VCSIKEWEQFREHVSYTFKNDNNFAEMRDAELLRERVTLLTQVQPYIGLYYSNSWVKRNVLRLSEEEVDTMGKEIEEEKKSGELPLPIAGPDGQMPGGLDQGQGQPGAPGQEPAPQPVDNTDDGGDGQSESMTPGLDRDVMRGFSSKR
jgi:hypothetical protein